MDIKYFGVSSFLIKSKDAKLVTDPFDSYIGYKLPKTDANIVTISHDHKDHNNVSAVEGNPLVINMPGEFEKNEIRVFGFQSSHGEDRGNNILFKIEVEGLSILHCGDLGVVPDEKFLETIGDVDVLMVPVGGTYTLNAEQAIELIKRIEPSIVIPMHYNYPKLDQKEYGEKLAPVSEFLKKMDRESVVPIPKLTIKKEELLEEMKVIVLEI